MDVNEAINFAQLVNAAYAVNPTNTVNAAGTSIVAGGTKYTVVTTIYANDLATDLSQSQAKSIVSIGLILQAVGASDVVIAIRGTERILEWVQDAKFGMVPCPFLAGAGNTEDGFTAMYGSLRTDTGWNSPSVVAALNGGLRFPAPVDASTSVTICGHSLGGALVTLLALDVAAHTSFRNPTVYSYASPLTGDYTFANMYDHMVPNTFRIANRMDLVTKVPSPPLYEHVSGLYELNPVRWFPLPPKVLVKLDPVCEHVLDTYLYLLSVVSGGQVLQLDPRCVPI